MKQSDQYIVSIMTKQVQTIDIDAELSDAEATMEAHGIHHLPVIGGKHLVGILSKTDINALHKMSEFVEGKVQAKSFFSIFSIEQLMTKEVHVVASDTSINEVARIFSVSSFHALPVMEGEDLVGIVSAKDVLRYYSE